MTSELVELGLRFTGSSTNIRPEGITAHYGGPSPWSGADRSSPAAFAATTDHARCPSIVRAWHDYHLSKKWYGFAYTSAVCPHGTRYNGRGPGKRTGANGTNDGNLRSYAVVYIAGDADPLTDPARRAFHDEDLRLGVPLRWDHSDWKATACAGDPIRAWEAAGWPPPAAASPPAKPPSSPSSSRSSITVALPTLGRGATGAHVSTVQALVNLKAGAGLTVDGDYGPRTSDAVTAWQRFFAIPADGIVGPRTWPSLLELPL